MKVKALKKILADVPDDYDVEFSKLFVIAGEKKKEDYYSCIFDFPVEGIARGNKYKHIRFILYSKEMTKKDRELFSCNIGRIRKIK